MFKKNLWIAGLILAVAIVFSGCLDPLEEGGGGGGGSTPFSFSGPWAGVMTAWGNNSPTITGGNTIDVTASTSTGFRFKYSDIGYTYNRSDYLVFTYTIDVTVPVAVVTLKSYDFGSDTTGESDYGRGKGREYALGDPVRSVYNGPVVNSTWNATTNTGTFEVKMSTIPSSSIGIGFQHNVWADDNGDGNKIAENSKYKVTFTKIENKVGAPPEPEVDMAGYNAATAISADNITMPWGIRNLTVNTATGELTSQPVGLGVGILGVKVPGLEANNEPLDDSDIIILKYRAILLGGAAKWTAKQLNAAGDGYVDISPSSNNGQYLDLKTDGRLQTLAQPSDIGIPASSYDVTKPNTSNQYIYFQENNWNNLDIAYRMKIISVEVKRQGKDPVTLRTINGYTAPVVGAVPVLTIEETAQYTGAVTFTGGYAAKKNYKGESVFDGTTAYTPTITLTAKDGYIFNLDNLKATGGNVFTLNGSNINFDTTTITASSATITFTLPSVTTQATPSVAANTGITGITAPVAGATRQTLTTSTTGVQNIAANNTQYKVGSISWLFDNPDFDSDIAEDPTTNPALIPPPAGVTTFGPATAYTLQITLNSHFGVTFVGVNTLALSPAVTGATVTVATIGTADEITLNVRFPATLPTVTNQNITLTAPVKGATPVRSVDNAQWSGTVRWFKTDNTELVSGTFAASTAYKAVIFLTAKTGFTLVGTTADSFTVNTSISTTHNAGGNIFNTSSFPTTSP